VSEIHFQKRIEASRQWHDSDFVCCNNDGTPLHPRTPYRIWKILIEAAGERYLKPHAMRHTHATLLLEEGTVLHIVAKRLGHKDPKVTATIYANLTPRQDDAAAEDLRDWLEDGAEDGSDSGEASW